MIVVFNILPNSIISTHSEISSKCSNRIVIEELERQVSLRRRVLNVRTIASFVFGILLLFLVSRVVFNEDFDWGEVVRRIGEADLGFLALAFLAYYATFPIRGFRWRYVLERSGLRVSFRDATEILFLSWFVNCLVPAKLGDLYRAYLLRGSELTQITHDHTFVQSLVDEGRLTPEEAATHPQRAELLRALHRNSSSDPDVHLREALAGDRYLLSTDGLHSVLDEQELREVLETAATPQEAVDELVQRVHKAGAPDNLSCVVIDAA